MSKPVSPNIASTSSAGTEKPHSPSRLKTVLKFTALTLFIVWFVVYLAIWIFSPMAVRHFAVQPLQDLQLTLAPQSTVRFNPFTSTLSIDELALLDKHSQISFEMQEAEVSVHLHRLFMSQLYVSAFTVSELMLQIEQTQGRLIVAGIDLSTLATKEPIAEDPIAEEQNADQPPKQPLNQPSNINLVLPELVFKQLNFNAKVKGVSQELVLSNITILDTKVGLAQQVIDVNIQALINQAPLTFSSSIDVSEQVGTITTNISLKEFALQSISPFLEQQGISAQGTLAITAAPIIRLTKESLNVTNDKLHIALDDLALNTSPWMVQATQNDININNAVLNTTLSGELLSASAEVNSILTKGNVSIAKAHNSAVNWQSIALSSTFDITGNTPSVQVSKLGISGLHLSEDLSLATSTPMLALSELALSNIQANAQSLAIERISLAGLLANIEINPDKSIAGLVDTSGLTANTSEAQSSAVQEGADAHTKAQTDKKTQSTDAQAEALFAIKLNELVLLDKGQVNVKDLSVSPVFAQTLSIDTLKAGPFDSQTPNAQSPFEILITDPNYLQIKADGFVSPFAKQLNAQVNAKVAELNLPSISPYVANALGFEMKSGQLDVNIDLSVKNDELDGNTNLFLRGIEMSGANDAEQGAISQGKAMPLNAALGMLKDDNGNVDLDVPLRGDVSAPSFGVESFLSLVLKKAAMSQAKDYLMTTFVPYASVVSVALSGAEYLLKVTFEPLVFDPTVVELPAQNSQFLSELAQLMKDTPDLQIKMCAQVTHADLALVKGESKTILSQLNLDSMRALGNARQANLKRYLVDQGIASNRVLNCASTFDSAKNALPRIELKTD